MLLSAIRFGKIPREIVFAMAKGVQGRQSRCYKLAHNRAMKHMLFSYWDRRKRKGQFRTFWITRINPAVSEYNIPYSRFILGLRRSNVHIDRKMMATLAETEPWSFKTLVLNFEM